MSKRTGYKKIKAQAEQAVENRLASFEHVVSGDESLEAIIALAIDDWEGDAGWRAANGRDHGRPLDDRLAVDFLRHRRTAYDWQLAAISEALYWLEVETMNDDGESPIESFFDDLKNDAHERIRTRTHDAIQTRFPELAGAIAHRRCSSYAIIGGMVRHVGRPRYLY